MENEVQIHSYSDGRIAAFYGKQMSEEAFEIAMRLNSLLKLANRKKVRFNLTKDTQLSIPELLETPKNAEETTLTQKTTKNGK